MDNMPYCQNCGREALQGLEVCSNCGSMLSQQPYQPINQMTTYPPPANTSSNKKIVAIIIVGVIVIATIGFILLFAGDWDENDGNNERPNVEISISTDKTTYNLQENANVTITVNNKMNKDFPYGDYSFDIFIVDKDEYDSMSYSYIYDTENYDAIQNVETLTVPGGEIESITFPWVLDTENYQGPGQYYLIFEIYKTKGNNLFMTIESASVVVTITE